MVHPWTSTDENDGSMSGEIFYLQLTSWKTKKKNTVLSGDRQKCNWNPQPFRMYALGKSESLRNVSSPIRSQSSMKFPSVPESMRTKKEWVTLACHSETGGRLQALGNCNRGVALTRILLTTAKWLGPSQYHVTACAFSTSLFLSYEA